MKTMIIERGLTCVEFFEKTRPGDLYLYVKALKEIGADYIEIDFKSLFRLPKPIAADNYIYRVESFSDIIIANNLPFSYAVVPLKHSFYIPKIDIPVILEAAIGKMELHSLISILAENVDFTKISLLRLIGDFQELPDEIDTLVTEFRAKYAVPIDFCPENNSLTALSTAISAYASGADSITMSFGDCDNFASIEEFAITLATMYRIIISDDFIIGICKAVIIATLFGNIKSNNLKLLMRQYGFSSRSISLLDCTAVQKQHQHVEIFRRGSAKKTMLERLLSDFNLDKETNEQLEKILRDCSAAFYSGQNEGEQFLSQ